MGGLSIQFTSKKEMTILFFARLFYPHIGGVEKHVLEVSKLLVKKGHLVTVLTEQYEDELKKEDKIDGIRIIRINNGKDDWFSFGKLRINKKKFRVWRNLWKHRQLIKDADVIHAHDVFFWYLPFRFLYPSKKVFTTFHGYEGNKIPGFKEKLMHKIAEKLSKGNICVGDFLKKWYGTRPDYVTYGAVSEIQNTRLDSAKRAKYKILFLGRLEEETGIMEYLKALLMLKNKGTGFELTILGDGKLRRKAEDFSRVNKINAKFKGFVGNVENYLVWADFIFTSRYLGILEALSYKKFIFAHYNNSIKKDYLGMAPFAKYISISKNYKELSDQIEYYLENKKKNNPMIDKGFVWVKNQAWSGIAAIYLKLWDKD